MASEYCRQWAFDNGLVHDRPHDELVHDSTDTNTAFTRDPDMTAHRPPRPPSPGASSASRDVPSVRAPSPVPPAPVSDDEDDDQLSINSSDLENSWLNIPHSEGGTSSVSGSVSALGSAAVSDLDPSSDSDHEWNSEFDSEGPTLRNIPDVGQKQPHDDSDSESEDGHQDTPSPVHTFQGSFIFPDPNSASASFTSGNETTPVPSLVDISAKDLQESSASLFASVHDGSKTQRVTVSSNAEASTSSGPSSASTIKPFPASAPKPKRGQMSALITVFACTLFFFKFGPAAVNFDWSGLLSKSLTPPGPLDAAPQVTTATTAPPGWDLQVVRDALSVLTAAEPAAIKATPPSKPDEPVAEATSTAYRWFRSEYRWSREDENKPVTDVVMVPSSSLTTTSQQIVATLNDSYDAMGSAFQTNIQLVSEYLNWTLQNLAAFASLAVDALRTQVEVELRLLREIADALYKPEHVRALFDSAAAGAVYSQSVLQASLQRASRASARICANDRCSPARAREAAGRTVSEARRRGYDTLCKARRGLDHVMRVANDAVGKAASEAQERYAPTDKDCLHDRDGKKGCYSSSRRTRSSKAKSKDAGRKDKRHGHAKAKHGADKGRGKCPLSRRLMRGCRAGGARA